MPKSVTLPVLEAAPDSRAGRIRYAAIPPGDVQIQILLELREIRAVLERLDHRRDRVLHEGHAVDLLLAIRSYAGASAFSSSALVTHAQAVPELAAAIVAACGILSARKVGRLLRRLEGELVGNLRVQRVGVDNAGVVWVVKSVE